MECSDKWLLKLSPLDPCNQVPREDRVLSDQVFATIEHFSKNKKFNGVSWLLLMLQRNLGGKK